MKPHGNHKSNPINCLGEYSEITLFNSKLKVLVDTCDIEKISDYCWYEHHSGYICSNTFKSRKGIRIHQLLIQEIQYGCEVDHINRIKSDNRQCNLRLVDRSQNCANRRMFKNNTSGYVGVHFYKPYSKWLAHIRVNKKRIHLGYFDSIEDAINSRKIAEQKYFMEV